MADRYWVGGTGTWDASTTTNWATTSGGAGGASAPTSADNAYFDGNSDAGAPFTVTMLGAVCNDLIIGDGSTVTVLNQPMTLAGGATWQIHGSLFFPATNLASTVTGEAQFLATTTGKTITTNGVIISNRTSGSSGVAVNLLGVGGEWTLGSDFLLASAGIFQIQAGSFDTASFNMTVGRFVTSSASSSKSLTLGSSTITTTENNGSGGVAIQQPTTFSGASAKFVHTQGAGRFVFQGVSGFAVVDSIRITTGAYKTFQLGNFSATTFYFASSPAAPGSYAELIDNVEVTGVLHLQSGYGATFDITDTAGAITAATVNAGGEGYNVGDVLNVTGGNGDAQLTVATLSGTAIATVTISTPGTGYTTATGVATTLATSALNPNRRLFIRSNGLGTARTITAAAVNITNVDFRDITGAGAATWSDSGRTRYWGDCLGNTGITFSAGVSKYRIGTGNWSATQWAASSGGSPAVGDFPLAQDTCVFDANTTTGTHTLDASYNIGTLDMSALAVAVTLATGTTAPTFYGNVTLDADVTLTGVGTFTFAGQGITQTITSAGRTFTQQLTANVPSGTVTLADTFTSTNRVTLTSGTFNINNQQATLANFVSANETTIRVLDFGASGALNLTALGDTWNVQNLTNFSFAGTQQVNFVGSGAYTISNTVLHGNLAGGSESTALSLNIQSGSGTFRLAGSSHLNNINTTGFAGVLQCVNNLVYGNFLIAPSVSSLLQTGYIRFLKTSGTQTLTTSGKTILDNLQKYNDGVLQLLDNVTTGATAQFELNRGTLDLNDKTLSVLAFNSSNSNTRSIDFGTGGRIELSGSSTVFNATTGTNLTTTGTGVIDLTSASTKTFAGGGRTYPTLNQGGSGTLLITGANTFADITNTVQPTTITFPSGVTTSVQDFSVGGTLGNLVTLNASTPGTRAILNRV